MQNCKLLIFNSDELKTIQCRSDDPASFVLHITDFDQSLIDGALHARLEWHENDRHCSVPVSFVKADGDRTQFAPQAEIIRQENEQYHRVEANEFIQMKKIGPDDVMEFKARADYINRKYRNSLTAQIKQLITEETVTNQYIFKLMLQIDSKLDELISAKQDQEDLELVSGRMLSLSGSGLCFIADDAEADDLFYLQTDSKYSTGFVFAALCRITNVIPAGNKRICEAEFAFFDEATRDDIIHNVFEKEREKLKRKNI